MNEVHHAFWEDGSVALVENVSERHFSGFGLRVANFGIVNELDVLEVGLLLEDDLCGSNSSIRGHL